MRRRLLVPRRGWRQGNEIGFSWSSQDSVDTPPARGDEPLTCGSNFGLPPFAWTPSQVDSAVFSCSAGLRFARAERRRNAGRKVVARGGIEPPTRGFSAIGTPPPPLASRRFDTVYPRASVRAASDRTHSERGQHISRRPGVNLQDVQRVANAATELRPSRSWTPSPRATQNRGGGGGGGGRNPIKRRAVAESQKRADSLNSTVRGNRVKPLCA